MKKSHFKKLKVGDKVTIRTLEELEQLKCYNEKSNCIFDDNGMRRKAIFTYNRQYEGREATVVQNSHSTSCSLEVVIDDFGIYIVRQHLKGE